MEEIKGDPCPFCLNKTLTLIEDQKDIPFFGKVYLYSMTCSSCAFHKSDVESADRRDPCKITFILNNTKDLNVRVVKGSEATVTLTQLKMNVRPGPASNGYVTNIEGVLQRFKKILEERRDLAEDEDDKKKAKALLKKMWKIECGDEPLTIVIEDPSGNSAIISEKAKTEKLAIKTA